MRVSIFAPVSSNVRSTIIQYNIAFSAFKLFSKLIIACCCCNISLEALAPWNLFDRIKVNSNDGGVEGHGLAGDLHPSSRSSTEVDEGGGVVEEVVFAIELY